MHKYLLIAFMGLFLTQTLLAQESAMFDSIDYNKLQIPPLEVLFENARKSPAVQQFQAKMEEEASLLKTEKRSWLKYFKVGGSWQYGRVGVNSAFSDEYTPLFYQYSSATQNNMYATASLSIPLDDIFDRKNRIKRQQMATQTTRLEMEKWHDEQKIRIIEMYEKVKKELAVLKVKIQGVIFASAQYEVAKKDFQNGNAKIIDVNTAQKVYMDAFEGYETTKAELNVGVLKLEVLSKTKIINK
ncbi:MAG: hypothetical protein H6Q14_2360 [Bacteroidetes bacterium]|nr:hypothetical protein [Bacteroidota bacterium]